MRFINTLTFCAIIGFLSGCAGNNTYTFALYNRGIDVSATTPADRSKAVGRPTKASNMTIPVTCHYSDC